MSDGKEELVRVLAELGQTCLNMAQGYSETNAELDARELPQQAEELLQLTTEWRNLAIKVAERL